MTGIPNFKVVGPGIYRGGQPTSEGWAYLEKLGVKTVLKLNFASEGPDTEAERGGMHVVDCGGPPSDVLNTLEAPNLDAMRTAMQYLAEPACHPLFFH